MNSGLKKRFYTLTLATILSFSTAFATSFDNNIVDIQFSETDDEITATIITEKNYQGQIKATKAGGYYNIILPNIGKGSKKIFTPNSKKIDFVKVVTLTSSTGGESYTKISIKLKSNAVVKAESKVYEETNEMASDTVIPQRPIVEQEQYEQPKKAEENGEITDIYENDANADSDDEAINTPQQQEPISNIEVNEPLSSQTTQTQQTIPQQKRRDHSSEILSLLIGTFAVILVVVLLYIKGKDKIQELCGDMGITIDGDNNKKEKNKTKQSNKKNQTKSSTKPSKNSKNSENYGINYDYQTGNLTKENKELTDSPSNEQENAVIDLDEIYSGPIKSTSDDSNLANDTQEAINSEDDDIDNFLESFVDQDNNETSEKDDDDENIQNNETTEETDKISNEATPINNNELTTDTPEALNDSPIDELIDDVIATQNMEFSDEDVAALQARLQTDFTPEIMEQTKQKQIDTKHSTKKLTVEEFDKKYPLLSDEAINAIIERRDIKFNDIDINVLFSATTAYEISEDAILEAQMRKEKEDEENIQYYENEKDFAFTLIKPQDVANPDELVVLDNNVYPDLANVDFSNDEIFKEFSFAKDNNESDKAPSTEDIDRAIAKEMEIINNEKQNKEQEDNILSEFKLIQPESTSKRGDDQFSTTVFTSMNDIEAQFKALGVDFESDNKEQTSESSDSTELNLDNHQPIVIDNTEEEAETKEFNSSSDIKKDSNDLNTEDAEILASCNIDFSTDLHITKYDNQVKLIGIKNGEIKKLYTFESGIEPQSITARKAEETETGETRYIVRADKEKFVIDVSDKDIKMVLAL